MKLRAILSFLLLVLALTSLARAQNPIETCFNYLEAQDYKRAIEAGKVAVRLYPNVSLSHLCLGKAYLNTGQVDLALESFKKAERESRTKEELAVVYNWMGMAYDKKGLLDEALLYYSKDLHLSKELGDKRGEAASLNNIAGIYRRKGEYQKALEYYNESLRLKTDEKEKAVTYNNIATLYSDLGDYKKAVEHYKKSLEIDERYGNYHGYAATLLNLGNIYRKMKDYKQAEACLLEGLKRVKKIEDRFWEGVAYVYLGLLYRDTGNRALAKEYLNKALRTFQEIGAQESALEALAYLYELEKVATTLYGGVEVGSKGVKAIALELKLSGDELYEIKELYRESINTTIIAGVKETGRFSKDGIEETMRALASLIEGIKKVGVPEKNIFVVASSAISGVSNVDEFARAVKEKTGYELILLDKDGEVLYNIVGAVPNKYLYSSVVVDIGSGNTKIGYLEEVGGKPFVRSFEIPYGTVSLTEEAKKRGSLRAGLREVIEKEVIPLVKREMEKKPAFKSRKSVFLIGGIVWATVSLTMPESVEESYVRVKVSKVEELRKALRANPKRALNPDLSKLSGEKRERALKALQRVREVFSEENLVAGTELLRAILVNLGTEGRELIFPRQGNWLIGYVVLNGYFAEVKR
ncbi:tetratricopeptide repeat protein [Thermodesulfobacterium thermophilum]|uniref:tetratricopeptide repeat protein n=1 Tax=Thermodesulfobacterium thermophilum TaxID=886 RepID=UPI0003B6DD2B|nr:tetratricopeptide repeat protein [Thermodesulfobacterium thermophilum]